jgi:hypothetical protein
VTTPDAAAAAKTHRSGLRGVKSREARSIAFTLLDTPRELRRTYLHTLSEKERKFVFAETLREVGSLYGQWHDDPNGFIEDVLGETMWGKQVEIIEAVAAPGVTRVVVPAGFGVGKTYLAGRLVAWAGAVNQIGTMRIVTTATRMRQVQQQLWPEIKTPIAKGALPGRTDTVQWVADDMYGNQVRIAYGFSAAPTDEAAMQGIHGIPKLFLVVDEAGGIAPMIGRGTNNLLTGDAKMLAIGNPAMNEPGSWFEKLSEEGEDPDQPATRRVQIATLDSPSITGEPTPICRACNPNLDGHTISGGVPPHLPSRDWLNRTLSEYGVDVAPDASLETIRDESRQSGVPYIIAKVLAEFPKDSGNQVMPTSWVESAELMADPMQHVSACEHEEGVAGPCFATMPAEDYVRLCDLGLEGEDDKFTVKRGSWVRLGVDVASDGGDEFSIYRSVGDVVHPRHNSSGSQNADSVAVAERVLAEIDSAQRLNDALGCKQPVRVKVDGNGLGWGVVGHLERWGKTGRHKAKIINVMVSQSPEAEDAGSVMKPNRKRDEMWLSGRFQLQPDPTTGYGRIRLRLDHKCKVQLSLPKLGWTAAGMVSVESKKSMKARGVSSPDRAEAALLALYEPYPLIKPKRRGLLN